MIGITDGKRVTMEYPKNIGPLYHSYNGFFSQILLAVCDGRYKFIFIDIGQYGSKKDGTILKNSELGTRLELYSLNIPSENIAHKNCYKLGQPFILSYYMVCDEIFQLKDYLMCPYPETRNGKLPIDQVVFNY